MVAFRAITARASRAVILQVHRAASLQASAVPLHVLASIAVAITAKVELFLRSDNYARQLAPAGHSSNGVSGRTSASQSPKRHRRLPRFHIDVGLPEFCDAASPREVWADDDDNRAPGASVDKGLLTGRWWLRGCRVTMSATSAASGPAAAWLFNRCSSSSAVAGHPRAQLHANGSSREVLVGCLARPDIRLAGR
jgi:hypothetical protein